MRTRVVIVLAVMLLAGVAHGDGPGGIPTGSGWWCMDVPGASGMCSRTRGACDTHVASLPWGGLPPPCVARRRAHCATYTAGAATNPPAPMWLCRRDASGCTDAVAQLRAQHRPREIVSASVCAAQR